MQSDRKLDFGTGFYLTSSYEQAEKWAILTTKRREKGKETITVYEIDESILNGLHVLKFAQPNEEWLRYVAGNRKNVSDDDYDVVIGPVANDRTMPVISLYFAGVYTEEDAIKRLLPQKLKDQYVFKTENALKALELCEVIVNE